MPECPGGEWLPRLRRHGGRPPTPTPESGKIGDLLTKKTRGSRPHVRDHPRGPWRRRRPRGGAAARGSRRNCRLAPRKELRIKGVRNWKIAELIRNSRGCSRMPVARAVSIALNWPRKTEHSTRKENHGTSCPRPDCRYSSDLCGPCRRRRLQVGPRFDAARRGAARHRHQGRVAKRDLPQHDPRLLGLCARTVRRQQARLRSWSFKTAGPT